MLNAIDISGCKIRSDTAVRELGQRHLEGAQCSEQEARYALI